MTVRQHPSGKLRSGHERQISLGWFLMPRLAEPDTRSASVLVDELDASRKWKNGFVLQKRRRSFYLCSPYLNTGSRRRRDSAPRAFFRRASAASA
jgi:hypothetical protein